MLRILRVSLNYAKDEFDLMVRVNQKAYSLCNQAAVREMIGKEKE